MSWSRRCLTVVMLVSAAVSLAASDEFTITHFAGPEGGPGYRDGKGAIARFKHPEGVAVDKNGRVYVADTANHVIRLVTRDGEVSTVGGWAGEMGGTDGPLSAARFIEPASLTFDASGNLWVLETNTSKIRKITPQGNVSSIEAEGEWGLCDVEIDSAGNFIVTNRQSHLVLSITPSGVVSILAGTRGLEGQADGVGATARFSYPSGVAIDSTGNIFVADEFNYTIRKITPQGNVTTFAGMPGVHGSVDGTGSAARFRSPYDLEFDAAGDLWVTDGSQIRRISKTGAVTTIAGTWDSIPRDGVGSDAGFDVPAGLAFAPDGTIVIADRQGQAIRTLHPSTREVRTLAGLASPRGDVDGAPADARFWETTDIAVDSAGNAYVGDEYNFTIRKVAPSGHVTTFAGTAGRWGTTDGLGSSARFGYINSVTCDPAGNVFVGDSSHTIRKITPGGLVSTIAGVAGQAGDANGPAASTPIRTPVGITFDAAGNLYFLSNHALRRISPSGLLSTVAGISGVTGATDGTGSAARFNAPTDALWDPSGYLYVADTGNRLIRRVSTATWEVTTFAGRTDVWWELDGTGQQASFRRPESLTRDAYGNLFVADTLMLRKIGPSAAVTTVAGVYGRYGVMPGTGANAETWSVRGISYDAMGNRILLADAGPNGVRAATSCGIPDLAGTPTPSAILGDTITLTASPQTATAFQWSILRRPKLSLLAAVSTPTSATTTFKPDTAGWYVLELRADGAAGTRFSKVNVYVACRNLTCIPPKGDLSGDQTADLIWRNSTNGQNSFWLLEDTTVIGGGMLDPLDTAWKLAGTGDFDHDGQSDLLWHHHGTGANTLWFMNGVSRSSQASIATAPLEWEPSGTGDFNGDGDADIVWRNSTTGANAMWLMSGTNVTGNSTILSVPDLSWKLVGTGDVNGDGKADLVWWNSTGGSVSVWFMNGTTRTGSWFVGAVSDTSWAVSAVGDFNGDGRADILWRNTIGGTAIWFLNGTSVLGGGFVGQVADTSWIVAGPR